MTPATLAEDAKRLFDITLTPGQVLQLDAFRDELLDWNTRINLTAITEPEAMRVRHFLDSLSLVKAVDLSAVTTIIDVGTGAGLPGMALAIAFPHLKVTLLDSTAKKLKFLDYVIEEMALTNVRTLHARAEQAGHISHHRAHYDLVLARAVARMPALVEYLLPLAKVGGRCVAMKGATAETETKDAAPALKILGGELDRITRVELPGMEDAHYLVTVKKTRPTPKSYPRQAGTPTRDPLS